MIAERIADSGPLSPASRLTDAELMAGVQAGDADALEALYDRHAPRMLGLALRMLGQREPAEDALQEAFLRVWRRAASFAPERGGFPGWLASIVRNLCLDYLRGTGAPVLLEADDDRFETALDPEPDVPTQVEALSRRTQVRQALAALPEAQRQIIVLSYFGGLTRRDIAARLGVPPGTVHTRARLALLRLRELLEPQADLEAEAETRPTIG
jgi:RNA polymerase sigma-70 factor (ECF subfamily)